MHSTFLKLISLLFIFFIGSKYVISQELDPLIDVNLDRVSPDVRDKLSNYKQDVTNYLTRTRFTNEDIVNDVKGKPYKIKCNFQFFFTGSTGFDEYQAQLVVIAQRNVYRTQNYTTILRLKDDNLDFNYLRGQAFYHDDTKFNNLTSLLDYYAYLIIAYDDDSWEPELGTKRFQKAQDLVNLAVANGQSAGWADNSNSKSARNTYTQDMLNSKYDNFREGFWKYHFAGIDSIQFNKRQALEMVADALDLIAKTKKSEVKSFTIKAFFDAKYLEIAQTLVDYYDKTIYRRLGEMDPDHLSTYEEYSKK